MSFRFLKALYNFSLRNVLFFSKLCPISVKFNMFSCSNNFFHGFFQQNQISKCPFFIFPVFISSFNACNSFVIFFQCLFVSNAKWFFLRRNLLFKCYFFFYLRLSTFYNQLCWRFLLNSKMISYFPFLEWTCCSNVYFCDLCGMTYLLN